MREVSELSFGGFNVIFGRGQCGHSGMSKLLRLFAPLSKLAVSVTFTEASDITGTWGPLIIRVFS